MHTVVIGATGHIGSYLVPRLLAAGHDVVSVTRGESEPYRSPGSWSPVEHVSIDREAAEAEGTFGERIRELRPDVVIDLICFELDSAERLVRALDGEVQHLLHCGTIWVHGPSAVVPTTEDQAREPFGEYGRKKAEIEAYLLDVARRDDFPVTVLHPGHIVGPGWEPLNPAGHFSPEVFERLANGDDLALPNLGLETVHHVHADDVAQAFEAALNNWNRAVGESFHVVSPSAVTLRGYAEAVAGWFGRSASLSYLPWEEWREQVSDEEAEATWDHIAHSPNCSIEKARHALGYQPRYTSLQAVRESVARLIEDGTVEADPIA